MDNEWGVIEQQPAAFRLLPLTRCPGIDHRGLDSNVGEPRRQWPGRVAVVSASGAIDGLTAPHLEQALSVFAVVAHGPATSRPLEIDLMDVIDLYPTLDAAVEAVGE